MVNTTQATTRQDIGHVVLLEHQYHSAAVYLEHTVAHIAIDMVVANIVIGAEAQHRLVLSAILLKV